jgi:FixJ family two-component response regulator
MDNPKAESVRRRQYSRRSARQLCSSSSGLLIQIKATAGRPGKIPPTPGRKQPMILILDDDDAVRDSLRLLLECAGFEARELASCREFLNAGQCDGDCLILDLHMPEMSGIELLEAMRRRGDILPVILITGRLEAMIRERARAAGALAVVEKPYKPGEILNLIRHVSGSHLKESDRRHTRANGLSTLPDQLWTNLDVRDTDSPAI